MSNIENNTQSIPVSPQSATPVMPNSPESNNLTPHHLDPIYRDVSDAIRKVSDFIHENPNTAPEVMRGLNQQLVAVIENVNAMAETNQKLEYAMTILERELDQCVAVDNSSRRVFGSFEELHDSTKTE